MLVHAYAKINIGLRILGKRTDGYHSLETVFHQIDNADAIEIIVLPEDEIRIHSDNNDAPADTSNLCWRAARMLKDITGMRAGVELSLQKRIPIGAGLGGGSADAAAVLLSLRSLWKLDLSDSELAALGSQLGSDVPFFIRGGTAFASGRGEILQPVTLNIPYWIVVATPPIAVSTAWAYKNISLNRSVLSGHLKSLVHTSLANPEILRRDLVNDFEPLVFSEYPVVAALKAVMLERGTAFALMSGSGSSVFAFVEQEALARSMAKEFSNENFVSLTPPGFSPEKIQ
jgi:4-diphosphocytidyl-2-C-methyl-D-erythritol kinase